MDNSEAEVREGGSVRVNDWELAVLDLFVGAAQMIGFPKSVGQIYGLLFCSSEPLPMDDFVERLGLSKGSVSQGLALLRQLGAVRVQFVVGDRRDHYVAEVGLRRLLSGFLREKIEPHLENGQARLNHLETLLDTLDPSQRAHAKERLSMLTSWHKQTRGLLPLVKAVVGKG